MSPFAKDLCERSKFDHTMFVGSDIRQLCMEIEAAEAKAKPRYDEALLRIYLSNMPLGRYHCLDNDPQAVYRDEMPVLVVHAPLAANAGIVAALVHLLNAREQTEITNGTKP